MTKQDIQFEIDQLRKDKIIYAVESTAMSVTAIVAMFFVGTFNFISNPLLIERIILGSAVLYWIYMGISNYLRLQHIKRLEKQLQ